MANHLAPPPFHIIMMAPCPCCRAANAATLFAGVSSPSGVHSFDPLAPGGRSSTSTTLSSAGGAGAALGSGDGRALAPAPSRASSAQYTEHLRPWEVRWEEFAFVRKIGGGSFGKVGGWVGGWVGEGGDCQKCFFVQVGLMGA